MERSLYTAGPMSNLTYEEFVEWRNQVRESLKDYPSITIYSPSRHKEFLAGKGEIPKVSNGKRAISTPKGILGRDFYDVSKVDLLLVNFLGAKTISIGTVCEMAFAYMRRIPIITVIEQENPHHHDFLHEITTFQTESLSEAIEIVKYVLLP